MDVFLRDCPIPAYTGGQIDSVWLSRYQSISSAWQIQGTETEALLLLRDFTPRTVKNIRIGTKAIVAEPEVSA